MSVKTIHPIQAVKMSFLSAYHPVLLQPVSHDTTLHNFFKCCFDDHLPEDSFG